MEIKPKDGLIYINDELMKKLEGRSVIETLYGENRLTISDQKEGSSSTPSSTPSSSKSESSVNGFSMRKVRQPPGQADNCCQNKGLMLGCRACILQKTDLEIKQRWANKLLPGEDWDVDDDEDYIHAHDAVEVVTVVDEVDPNIKWTKLEGNQSTFGPVSKKMFTDCMEAYDVLEVNLSVCPIELFDSTMWTSMEYIQRLNLSGCNLESVPEQIRSLRNLRHLDLSYNDLSSFPDWFCELCLLEKLDVYSNKFSCLSDEICKLSNLNCLNFGANNIAALPERLGELTNLTCIEGPYNKLVALPDCFGSLKLITKIDFRHNFIHKLPPSFADLTMLDEIDLSENILVNLPETIKFASTISTILIDSNFISELPEWFGCLPKLKNFSCKANKLVGDSLREDFLEASKQLKELNFNGNEIGTLPDTIASIDTLTHLEVGSVEIMERQPDIKNGNKLKVLPPLFGVLLSDLVELTLDENNISVLPDGFGSGLVNLVRINLFRNELTEIPSSFCLMKNLKECVLSHNKLKTLPENFADLVNLTHLNLDHNEMNHFPLSFYKCPELSTLDLVGNKFVAFPSNLARLPKLTCLGFDIDLCGMPIVMRHHMTGEAVLKLHKSIQRGLEHWCREPSSIAVLNSGNESFLEALTLDYSSRKRKWVDSGYYSIRVNKHARTHFDFFNKETMILDDDDQWKDGNRPLSHLQYMINVVNAEKVRDRILQELAFTERPHMPRLPGKPVPVPLFNKNPLKHYGRPLAYRHLPPLKTRRHYPKGKKHQK